MNLNYTELIDKEMIGISILITLKHLNSKVQVKTHLDKKASFQFIELLCIDNLKQEDLLQYLGEIEKDYKKIHKQIF